MDSRIRKQIEDMLDGSDKEKERFLLEERKKEIDLNEVDKERFLISQFKLLVNSH